MDKPAKSKAASGAPIYRYDKPPEEGANIVFGDADLIEAISAHIERYFGAPSTVWHELVSNAVHVDVHVVEPTPERNFYTLITSGMSQRAMPAPRKWADCTHCELMLCLPPDWPTGEEELKREENNWPIHLLRQIARLAHIYKTWFWELHTIPNGDPPERFAKGVNFRCAMLAPPSLCRLSFRELRLPDRTVHFHALLPLYREEMELKLREGAAVLLDRFKQEGVTELVNVGRKNLGRRKLFGLF